MSVKSTPHLNFRGNARAALAFYHAVFGGEQMVVTYKDAGAVGDPSEADQVMYGQVAADTGFRIMAYDVPSRLAYDPGTNPVFVSVRSDAAGELSGYWEKLVAGATIIQPLAPSGWSPLYGMLKDRFGITWVLDVEVQYAGS